MKAKDMKDEKGKWEEIVNFHAWQICKILDDGEKYFREIVKNGFVGSLTTLEKNLDTLTNLGFVRDRKETQKRYFKLTGDGRKFLELCDWIGEKVKQHR